MKHYDFTARMVSRLKELSHGVVCGLWIAALACGTAAAIVLPASAQTASQTATRNFDVPAGPLGTALLRFGEQSGLQFSVGSDLTKDRRTQGIRGKYVPEDGLRALLAGSGLTFRFTGPRTVVVEPIPNAGDARVLGPLRVEGTDSQNAVNGINGSTDATATEGSRSYTTGALSVASKTPQAIKDTPQSVSVVTQQKMQDQNITDFTSLMTQATGISVVTGTDSTMPIFYSRGFAIERLQIDGGAPMDIGTSSGLNTYALVPQIDMALYDHAEILRGADGIFNGYGSPGGVINLTRKRPLNRAQVVVEGQFGSWNNHRYMLDVAGPLGSKGLLRGRGVIAYQDQDFFYDTSSSNKTLVYGVLEADVGSRATVSAGASITSQDMVPFIAGLPRYQSGADLKLDRSTCLCFPWNRYDFDTTELFGRVDYRFTDNWALKLNATHTEQERSSKYGAVSGTVNPVSLAGPVMVQVMNDRASTQWAADATVDGSFELFGKRQTLVVGANYSQVDGSGFKRYAPIVVGSNPVNVFDFDPRNLAYFERASTHPIEQYPEYGTEQWGAYASLNLTFWDPLHLNIGLRYSNFSWVSHAQNLNSSGNVYYQSFTKYSNNDFSWPPSWSLMYDVTSDISVYGSVTDIYQDQSTNLDRSGNPLSPITGTNIEGGIKWAGRDGRLNASLAFYQLKQENFAVIDGSYSNPDDYFNVGGGIHYCCFTNDSDRTYLSQGVDLELTGELLPGLQVSAGYTFNMNKYQGELTGANEGRPLVTKVPRNLLKLWGTYQFQEGDLLSRLSVGGGVTAQSRSYTTGSACTDFIYGTDVNGNPTATCRPGATLPFDYTQGSYALISARVAFQINSQWNVALNINNLTDRIYYQTMGTSANGNWYGEPRSFMLTLRGSL